MLIEKYINYSLMIHEILFILNFATLLKQKLKICQY